MNIPRSCILTSEEMSILIDIVGERRRQCGMSPFSGKVYNIERKLQVLNAVFRNAENLSWNDYALLQSGQPLPTGLPE